jgi:sigma-B regulation protein RsbU (phosphoserine phosphatase)
MMAGATRGPAGATWTAVTSEIAVLVQEALRVQADHSWMLMDDAVETLPFLLLTGLLAGELSRALERQQRARLAAQEENLRLQHEGQVIRRELELAAQVQLALLPRDLPQVPGVVLSACYRPSRMIGGDLYDVLPMVDGSWLFLVADVSGHGIPAALLTASTQQAVRHCAGVDLVGMFAAMNEVVLAQAPDGMFVTAVGALFDPQRGTLRWVNAGHPRPLWCRAAADELLAVPGGGVALGLLPGAPYEIVEAQLAPGDLLLLYTDGATDAYGPHGERIEEEGLRRLLAPLARLGPERAVAGLAAQLTAAGEPSDDITLLAIQWLGPGQTGSESSEPEI